MAVRGNDSWKAEKLEDICAQITDGKHGDCQDERNSGFYFLSCKDVTNGKLNYEGARQITKADFLDTHRRTKFEPSDVLITNSGTIGRMALAPNNELTHRTTFQKSVAILKPTASHVAPNFLYYALQSDIHRLIEFAGGTAQKNLLLRDLRAFEIRVPSQPVQQRIASILSAYDELIENNQRRIRILEEMARSLYREWFVHFRYPGHESVPLVDSPLGQIPQGWEVKKLGDIAEDIRRNMPKGQLDEPQPYVGLEHIPRRSLALDSWETASELGSNKLAFKKGEVLFGKIRPYFHKVSIAPFDGLCSADTIVIRARQPEHYAIVVGCVSSDEFVAHATATSNGSKMPRANWNVLKEHPIAIPTSKVAHQFSAVLKPALQHMQTLIFQTSNLRDTRDLLLPRLLSGQIDIKATTTLIEEAIA